jgi:hypothetical protein
VTAAQEKTSSRGDDTSDFSFAPAWEETTTKETTTTTTVASENEWEIEGPIFLRSADPEERGEVVLKNTFGYSTSSDGTDDDIEYELEVEWGVVENHELIFEVPVEMGDGGVDGNADITLGWHWRLWREQDWVPAFALRNYVRIPSGYHSEGVDYEARGLITKTLVPGKLRAHLNPFLRSLNGELGDSDREHFQWGAAAGADYRIADNLLFVFDYVHESAETEGIRNQHLLEFDVDWEMVEHHKLGVSTQIGLDGDSEGPNFGVMLSYMYSFKLY